jgi:excisionase family DNA binding protein
MSPKSQSLEYKTHEIAEIVGVSPKTIYNWLKAGKIREPRRDLNDYRVWTQSDLDNIMKLIQLREPKETSGEGE